MGAAVGGSKGPMADINVTPLIDVVLVLLVVFMVITPMLSSGLQVDLPMATTTKTVNDAGQHIVISLTADMKLAVDQEVLDLDPELPEEQWKEAAKSGLIAEINRINTEKKADWATCDSEDNCGSILVKADASLEYGKVRRILDILGNERFTSVFIAAGKEK
jgi:biopolymer transport protein ExbD